MDEDIEDDDDGANNDEDEDASQETNRYVYLPRDRRYTRIYASLALSNCESLPPPNSRVGLSTTPVPTVWGANQAVIN